MKSFNLRFLFLFAIMLCAQQVFSNTPTYCATQEQSCTKDRDKYIGWGQTVTGSCDFSQTSALNYADGTQYRYVATLYYAGVSSEYLCSFVCPTGQFVDLNSGTCVVPPTPGSGGTSSSSGSAPFNSPTDNSCNIALDSCRTTIAGREDMACFLWQAADGLANCMYSSNVTYSNCMVCSSGRPFQLDPTGHEMTGVDPTEPGVSASIAGRETECASKGGTWKHSPAVPSTTGFPDDAIPERWSCTTATETTWYSGNGQVISPQSQTKPQELNCGGTTGISCESTQKSVDNSLKTLVLDIKGINDKFKEIFSPTSDTEKASPSVDILTVPEYVFLKNIWGKMRSNTKAMCKIKLSGGWRPKVEIKELVIDMKFEDLDTLFCDIAYVIRSIIFTLTVLNILHFLIQR